MKLRTIALNNLRRRKAKALFLLTGLAVGVASVVALFTAMRAMESSITHTMEEYGANILITPRHEGVSLSYAGLDLGGVSFDERQLREEDLQRIPFIENAANVRTVSPKLFGAVEARGARTHQMIVAGVDFEAEFQLKPWWKLDGRKPDAETEVLLGADAARALGLATDDTLALKDKSFTVAGVLQATGSQDDALIFAGLGAVQALLGKPGAIAMAEVAAHCSNCPIEDIVAQLTDILPMAKVTAVQQAVQGRMDALASMQRLSAVIAAMVLLAGGLVVFVTMMASVNERTREIGIFGAIGFRRGHILRLILLEAGLVSLAAGVIGYVAGVAGSNGLLRLLGHAGEQAGHGPGFDPLLAGGAVLLALTLGLAASALPAARASRMDPVSALRSL